jgi:hypothetical protein
MPKQVTLKEYVICWGIGFGDSYGIGIVQAPNAEEAQNAAYEAAREEFESSCPYECLGEATDELKEEYGL